MTQLVKDVNNNYGDTHTWKNIYTHQWGVWGGRAYSDWECTACGEKFTHYYHEIPNIRDAMRRENIPDICQKDNIT
jgi:hypothetical protein